MKRIFSVMVLAMLVAMNAVAAGKKKPNVLFVFADDQCYKTINTLGNKEIKTPTLDRMVHEGVTFTHAYNMGAWGGAVCVASRAMMNTGMTVWNVNREQKNMNQRVENRQMWSQLMEDAGYETYMTGKWHVKADANKIFNHANHIRPGMPNQTKERYNRNWTPGQDDWSPYDKSKGGFWKGGKHWSEIVADDAISYIEDAAKKDKPFFAYVAFNAPHDPRQSPKKYVDMYPLENISVPVSFLPEYPYKDEMGCPKTLRDEKLAPFPRTEYSIKVNRQEYYAIITHLDDQLARILDALEKSGEKDNTYIFYSADHGLSVGHHGLVGKQSLYDHSMRPPMIVIGPDLPKDKKLDMDVYLQDIMASALDLAGVEKPAYVEFNSLMPLARGKQKKGNYDAIYGGYRNLQRMVRKDNFKLILYPEAKKVLLFDLKKDPEEMKDLSDVKKYQSLKKKLFKELLELQKQMNDEVDLKAVYPELI
ncbi:DUF4976 domain-containing protein [Puteibacter caeruleilacunae]|nr:DUF4976 domain-containing protein [Puteibacter caeruleilacunae]